MAGTAWPHSTVHRLIQMIGVEDGAKRALGRSCGPIIDRLSCGGVG